MVIKYFNFWHFFWIIISGGIFVGFYFLLKNRSERVKKIVLFSILIFALLLHFLKFTFPPYSTDESRMLRDSWFINICGANIFLFPFFFLSKNKVCKDYMILIGILSGIISVLVPMEPIAKGEEKQSLEQMDIIRFYIHHNILWMVPMLMLLFKMHVPNYRCCITVPTVLLLVMLFIMLNQILQSELGYIPPRDDNFFIINFKDTSYIWGSKNDGITRFLQIFTPKFFKTVPVGEHAGEFKLWPWFWIICPVYIILTPLVFGITMIYDHQRFINDFIIFKNKIKKLVMKDNAN